MSIAQKQFLQIILLKDMCFYQRDIGQMGTANVINL